MVSHLHIVPLAAAAAGEPPTWWQHPALSVAPRTPINPRKLQQKRGGLGGNERSSHCFLFFFSSLCQIFKYGVCVAPGWDGQMTPWQARRAFPSSSTEHTVTCSTEQIEPFLTHSLLLRRKKIHSIGGVFVPGWIHSVSSSPLLVRYLVSSSESSLGGSTAGPGEGAGGEFLRPRGQGSRREPSGLVLHG